MSCPLRCRTIASSGKCSPTGPSRPSLARAPAAILETAATQILLSWGIRRMLSLPRREMSSSPTSCVEEVDWDAMRALECRRRCARASRTQVNNVLRSVDPGSHNITTIAGNGTAAFGGDGGNATAASAAFSAPAGVTVDAFGDLIVADTVSDAPPSPPSKAGPRTLSSRDVTPCRVVFVARRTTIASASSAALGSSRPSLEPVPARIRATDVRQLSPRSATRHLPRSIQPAMSSSAT